jgi:dolichol-phosphate mannosyltransferase
MHRFLPVLVRMQGHTVREVPVHHRPRATGRSHYGLLDRLFPGLRDVAGVRWLMSRSRRWRIVESGEGDPEP